MTFYDAIIVFFCVEREISSFDFESANPIIIIIIIQRPFLFRFCWRGRARRSSFCIRRFSRCQSPFISRRVSDQLIVDAPAATGGASSTVGAAPGGKAARHRQILAYRRASSGRCRTRKTRSRHRGCFYRIAEQVSRSVGMVTF